MTSICPWTKNDFFIVVVTEQILLQHGLLKSRVTKKVWLFCIYNALETTWIV